MSKTPSRLLLTLLGAAAVIAGAFYFGFQGSRSDAETSRMFMTHAAAGETAQAYALLHPGVTGMISAAEFAEMVDGMEAYTQIDFPAYSFSSSNGTRTTELEGTASTDAGCESELTFTVINGLINAFNISPLCNGSANDA